MKTKDIVLIALCTAIMVICSWISIPAAVPFTLQTMGVFLALSILGGKNGTLAIVIYILLGVVGLPVFSGFKGGLSAVFGSTGGYIVGFIIIGIIVWLSERLPWKDTAIPAMIAGLLFCYLFGTIWYVVIYTQTKAISFLSALSMCVFPFIIPDIIKLIVARIIFMCLKRAKVI